MTLHETDLDAAVADCIVTAEQAAALRAFSAKRARDRALALGHEERFHFMRSFNDLFFAIGVALFGGGMTFFAASIPLYSLIGALIIWALAELLVGRMRLVLPGILLSCLFIIFVAAANPIAFWFGASTQTPPGWEAFKTRLTTSHFQTFGVPVAYPRGDTTSGAIFFVSHLGGGIAAAALFYIRFRLPFALLLIAGGCVLMICTAAYWLWPSQYGHLTSFILLACGFLVFVSAMAFDASDRERLTRRADCAFWLHLLAAPLIVHPLIQFVLPSTPWGMSALSTLNAGAAIWIGLIFVALAVVAIITDRRALLVSALIYLGAAIGHAITGAFGQSGADSTIVFFATLLLLGALVVMLGVGWQPLRRLFLRALPIRLAGWLPPILMARPKD